MYPFSRVLKIAILAETSVLKLFLTGACLIAEIYLGLYMWQLRAQKFFEGGAVFFEKLRSSFRPLRLFRALLNPDIS